VNNTKLKWGDEMVPRNWMWFALSVQGVLNVYSFILNRWDFTIVTAIVVATSLILVYKDSKRSKIEPSCNVREFYNDDGTPVREFVIDSPNGIQNMVLRMECIHDEEPDDITVKEPVIH
jgi:hypothetical protein